MKNIRTTSLFAFAIIVTVFSGQLSIILLVMIGGISLYWLLSYFWGMRKEINLLKEENQYFMDSFRNIRSPLSLVHTPLKTVCGENCPENIKKDILLAIRNMDCLNRHLKGLVDLKQMFAQFGSVDVVECELGSFLKGRLNDLREYAVNKHVTVEFKAKFNYGSVWIDQSKILPMIDRFVKNVIDCAEPEDNVIISAFIYQDYWEIRIIDSADSKLKRCYSYEKRRLFKRRTECEYNFAKSILCKRLMELCGGKIFIDDLNHTISLQFPVKCPYGKMSERVATPYIATCREEEKIDTQFCGTLQKRSSVKPVVILVDSNEEFRFYLETCLSDDYVIKGFENGTEALVHIKEEYPDLVVSDTVLHGMSGDELSSRLKTSGMTSVIPVILYGSQVDIDQRYKREASLADTFLQSPFHVEDLKIEMSVLIRNNRFLRKSFLRKVFGEGFLQDRVLGNPDDDKDVFIDKVKDFILENIEIEHLTIIDVASKFNMSRTTFYKKWKSLTGESPKYIIFRIRMEKGRELLESGIHNVNEIPEMIGMKDVSNFRAAFKKYFKMTPRESIKRN